MRGICPSPKAHPAGGPVVAAVIALASLAVACGGQEDGDQRIDPEAPKLAIDENADPVMRTAQNGPVKLTVTVKPKSPRLGDLMRLELLVEAGKGIEITMPEFGEALGRFLIVDSKASRQEVAAGTVHRQVYTLQAPMSGRQRIPSLRVEYVDTRKPDDAETRELLTEDFTIEVRSVSPDGAVAAKLRPAPGKLEPRPRPGWLARNWPFFGLGLALVILGVAAFYWRRHRDVQKRISAYEVAMRRLRGLEESGMPGPEEADEWYVDLSGVVRRYLEDRFSLRAPELTTEEFLRVAGRSGALTGSHRELLASFLHSCDRVKFAAYQPAEEESREALESARSFIEETRPESEEVAT